MPSKPKHSLRFSRLKLFNWRNFAKVDVRLQRRVFLVGPNASGKSNLLDSFRFLHDLVAVGGGFQKAVQETPRGGVSKLRCLAARRYSDIVVEVEVQGTDAASPWVYELAFNQDRQQHATIRKERVSKGEHKILDRPDDNDKRDPERLTQTFLEQVNVNREFRELADFFLSIRYLHLIPQLIRHAERYRAQGRDPFGSDFLEQVAGTQERTRKARFRRIRDALKVAVPQLQDLEFYRDDIKGTPHLRGKYVHWRDKGAWQSEEQFSDGTLRLLGLLWSILDGVGTLLMEEPELSLHSEIVRFLPQLFARVQSGTGRQILVSTHSPDLLRDEGIGLDEVLLLTPSDEGTDIRTAESFRDIRDLLDGGVPLPEAILPHTRPSRPEQLALFDV